MILPLIFFTLFTGLIFYLRWRSQQPEKEEEKPNEKPAEKKPEKKKTNWGGWVVTGAVVALLAMIITQNLLAPKAPVAKSAITTFVVMAKLDQWSENISIPPDHWFRIRPEGKILVKTWDGREIEDEPGKTTWLGNEILDANFKVRSRENGEVRVIVLLQKKT